MQRRVVVANIVRAKNFIQPTSSFLNIWLNTQFRRHSRERKIGIKAGVFCRPISFVASSNFDTPEAVKIDINVWGSESGAQIDFFYFFIFTSPYNTQLLNNINIIGIGAKTRRIFVTWIQQFYESEISTHLKFRFNEILISFLPQILGGHQLVASTTNCERLLNLLL